MTVEMKPLGNSCNLACVYCYQEPMRKAGNTRTSKGYDLELMMKIADSEYNGGDKRYTLFGGEALLVPEKDLEILFKSSYDKYGGSAIQTNGSLINDKHIKMFKKYNVNVGISIDGPNELNSLRVPCGGKKTVDELTKATMDNIVRLVNENVQVGIIITVHKMNGTKDKLPRLINFIQWLDSIGIKGGNIHMMEVDSEEAMGYCLSSEENEYAFLHLAEWLYGKNLRWYPFQEMEEMMRGDDSTAHCVWKSCDPMNTQSVFGIEGNGQKSNCGMVNKEGIEWTKAEKLDGSGMDINYMRDFILFNTPDEFGGCSGCRFFIMCNGYCPGSSINSDWRNKTIYCSTLKKLFSFYEGKLEEEGIVPFSKRPNRATLEKNYISHIENGSRLGISVLENIKDVVQVPVGKRGVE